MKRLIALLLMILTLCTITGFSKQNNSNNKKMEVSINSEIKEYGLWMSSTPGIPLTVQIEGNEAKGKMKFHWVTEQGTFLNWQQENGKINVLGKDVTVNYKKIYWSVDSNKKITSPSFKIYLEIENNDTSKVIYRTNIEIKKIKEGLFSIKK